MAGFINIGFGNIVNRDKIVAVVSPDAAPVKRMVQQGKEEKIVIDATQGRRTKAVLVTQEGFLVLSALQPDTIGNGIGNYFFSKREKSRRTKADGHAEESRVYPSFFDACTPLWISENPLLWFSEQPNENKKSKIDFQTPGLSEIQTSLYRSVYCRTTESRMEL